MRRAQGVVRTWASRASRQRTIISQTRDETKEKGLPRLRSSVRGDPVLLEARKEPVSLPFPVSTFFGLWPLPPSLKSALASFLLPIRTLVLPTWGSVITVDPRRQSGSSPRPGQLADNLKLTCTLHSPVPRPVYSHVPGICPGLLAGPLFCYLWTVSQGPAFRIH